MPYIAVSAELIHTTQFHLPRTVATDLNQGLGYGFNLKILVFYENHEFFMATFEKDGAYCFVSVCWLVCIP